MDHGYITVQAVDARKAAKLYYQDLRNKTQNLTHPEVLNAGRFLKGVQILSDTAPVQLNTSSPIIDYLKPSGSTILKEAKQ